MNYTAKMRRELERSRGLTEHDAARLEAAADAHRESGYVRCERLDCLRLVVGYLTSKVDGCRVCIDCYRKEKGHGS